MNKLSNIITAAVFLAIVFGFAVWGLAAPDLESSESENRSLAKFPEINLSSVFSKGEDNAMSGFEAYVSDHFPARDGFRELKAWISYNIYGQKLNNGYFKSGDHVGKIEERINEDSIAHFSEAVGVLYEKCFMENENVFYTVVPDKGYFLAEEKGYPAMNYDKFFALVASALPEKMEYIDITDTLSISDYYYTDIHWSSERLEDTVRVIAEKMGFSDRLSFDFEIKKLTDGFEGVYFGQAAIPLESEPIYYITSPAIEYADVSVELTDGFGVYNEKYDTDINGYYTYFLHGSKSYITIENPMAENENELVVVRDSFGSSIVPWFIEAYKKITVVDTRYISPHTLTSFIENSNADVLFIYSTSIINDSSAIKK